jgi:hypothetical protein
MTFSTGRVRRAALAGLAAVALVLVSATSAWAASPTYGSIELGRPALPQYMTCTYALNSTGKTITSLSCTVKSTPNLDLGYEVIVWITRCGTSSCSVDRYASGLTLVPKAKTTKLISNYAPGGFISGIEIDWVAV